MAALNTPGSANINPGGLMASPTHIIASFPRGGGNRGFHQTFQPFGGANFNFGGFLSGLFSNSGFTFGGFASPNQGKG